MSPIEYSARTVNEGHEKNRLHQESTTDNALVWVLEPISNVLYSNITSGIAHFLRCLYILHDISGADSTPVFSSSMYWLTFHYLLL